MTSPLRPTERSMSSTVLFGLQGSLSRLGELQRQLSSGKLITRASDNPTGAVSAMQYRGNIATLKQYSRNGDDGLGWLGTADSALTGALDQVNRARELVLQGMSSGAYSSPDSREALAVEVDGLRKSLIGVANTKYLDRPIFGGTTTGQVAFDNTGAYVGDTGSVQRTVGANTKVRVDTDAAAVFGSGNTQLFTVLAKISSDLRSNPDALSTDLTNLDTTRNALQAGLSGVGARYNQVSQMRQAADDRVLDLSSQLSEVEDVDLPKTLTDLQMQQTAYQAALAAGARVVQPSLMDFLR
jgi:flagellar hook-associated protein 3 FlgL